jgi:hypothetical protein
MMRWILSGMLILWGASALFAQATGEVESIGFGNVYRPGCWTPMVVRLQPQTGQSAMYQIRIIQEDLDRDRILFTKTIALDGNVEGRSGDEQRFWTYFIPQPTDHGLPEPADGLRELQQKLKVLLCTSTGKPITPLAIQHTISSVEPYTPPFQPHLGQKLILVVVDRQARSMPALGEFQKALGLVEMPRFVTITLDDIPDNVIGLEGVDAIVLSSADPAPPEVGNRKIPILRQFVRQGGRLVLCQYAQWQRMEALGDLLPVLYPRYGQGDSTIQGMMERSDLHPLRDLAIRNPEVAAAWDRPKGPFKVAIAQAKPGAVVDQWMTWQGSDAMPGLPGRTPWLVRQVYGLGSVTWVAQDLGDSAIVGRAPAGWLTVWDTVFDWNNTPLPVSDDGRTASAQADQWGPRNPRDLGVLMLGGMSFTGKSTVYILLALLFFLLYWFIAGPGSYFYLRKKKWAALSWIVYGATAVAATVVTIGVVKVVLRGSPQIHHWTVVRTAPGQPAIIRSHFGLYIPRGNEQRVEIKGFAPQSDSTLRAFAIHPQHVEASQEFPAYMEYTLSIGDAMSDDPVAAGFPYRSTSKKLQAQWIGDYATRIEGSARLMGMQQGTIAGTLTNGTPYNLTNVYIAFHQPRPDGPGEDWLLYLPSWSRGASLDLNREFRGMGNAFVPQVKPGPGQRAYGRIATGNVAMEWANDWYDQLRAGTGDWNDNGRPIPISIPILSFFDRLPTPRNTAAPGSPSNRFDLLRIGARGMDLSQVLGAGGMVVLAQAHGPLPFPLEVEGEAVGGEGTILYQAVIPLEQLPPAP